MAPNRESDFSAGNYKVWYWKPVFSSGMFFFKIYNTTRCAAISRRRCLPAGGLKSQKTCGAQVVKLNTHLNKNHVTQTLHSDRTEIIHFLEVSLRAKWNTKALISLANMAILNCGGIPSTAMWLITWPYHKDAIAVHCIGRIHKSMEQGDGLIPGPILPGFIELAAHFCWIQIVQRLLNSC